MNLPYNWPFDQAPDCAVFTTAQVLDHGEPILCVYHDEDDHGWQFIGATSPNAHDARIIALKEAVALDATILEVADIQPGWMAWRPTREDAWYRETNQRQGESAP